MCGIAFIMRKDGRQALRQLRKVYEKQKGRGTQGFGCVAFTDNRIDNVFRSSKESDIFRDMRDLTSTSILFHHRFPTSTPNFKEASHPIFVSNPRLQFDYYVVHNGVITNDDSLKEKHEKLGYKYTTEMSLVKTSIWKTLGEEYQESKVDDVQYNDSEAMAIELAESIESNDKEVRAYGSMAFICIQCTKKTETQESSIVNIFYGRNTNPLILEDNGMYFKLSSEGNGEEIESHKLFKYNLASNIVFEKECEFGYKKTWVYNVNKDKEDNKTERVDSMGNHWNKDGKFLFNSSVRRDDTDDVLDEFEIKNVHSDDKTIENYADLSKKDYDNERYYDDFESCLTGQETEEELLKMMKKAEDRFDMYESAGMTKLSNAMWSLIEEIEEALEVIAIEKKEKETQEKKAEESKAEGKQETLLLG